MLVFIKTDLATKTEPRFKFTPTSLEEFELPVANNAGGYHL
jgi:hypothetical protein